MSCFQPLKGYRSREKNPDTGKYPTVWKAKDGYIDLPRSVPCGNCPGCKMRKARDNAIRLSLESSLYDYNCFITLTYNDSNLPDNGSISLSDPVDFMKRLREFYGPGIRSSGVAEYGDDFGRPHYHICLLNHHFSDQKYFKKRNGFPVFRSEKLEQLWPYGYSEIGTLTFQSAAYVSRYILKKMGGHKSKTHYERVDLETGEIYNLEPERRICISRMPGIGRPWLEKFQTDIYPKDFVTIQGVKYAAPKYFDYRLEIDNPELYDKVISKRKTILRPKLKLLTPERINEMEYYESLQIKKLTRSYENGSQD